MKFIFYYLVSIIVLLYTTFISPSPAVSNTKIVVIKTTSSNGRPSMRGPSPKRRRSPSPKRRRSPSPKRGRSPPRGFRG
uniref:Uncharacterized protein n=1 Tax=Strongyloides stercoralis TaxID=6248 RepID=A0A0K0E2S7_STRER